MKKYRIVKTEKSIKTKFAVQRKSIFGFWYSPVFPFSSDHSAEFYSEEYALDFIKDKLSPKKRQVLNTYVSINGNVFIEKDI